LRKFQSAAKMNSAYPLLSLYLTNSKSRINAGADKQSIVFKAVIVFGFALIAGVVAYLFYPKIKSLRAEERSSSSKQRV